MRNNVPKSGSLRQEFGQCNHPFERPPAQVSHREQQDAAPANRQDQRGDDGQHEKPIPFHGRKLDLIQAASFDFCQRNGLAALLLAESERRTVPVCSRIDPIGCQP